MLLVPDTLQFGNDTDSMFRRRTSNNVEFRLAGSDIVRISTSGLQVENGSLEVESGNVIASGNISGSATSTGSFGSLVVSDKVQGALTISGDTTSQGNLQVRKSFPDITLRADNEQRLNFSDDGNAIQSGIKNNSGTMKFYGKVVR